MCLAFVLDVRIIMKTFKSSLLSSGAKFLFSTVTFLVGFLAFYVLDPLCDYELTSEVQSLEFWLIAA